MKREVWFATAFSFRPDICATIDWGIIVAGSALPFSLRLSVHFNLEQNYIDNYPSLFFHHQSCRKRRIDNSPSVQQ